MNTTLILLSTYNGEKYLSELIESLLHQKDVDVHVLIRDDGSTDSTVEYLNHINDPRVTYYSGQNKKSAGSFLELIQQAPTSYDYYAFCDQDDVWLEDKLSAAISKLNKYEKMKPSLYYSGQIITDDRLNILHYHNLDINRSKKANCIFNQMAGCTAVFNKALLIELKKYIPKNIYGHDVWCYRLCVALGGNIVVDSSGRILYRQHGANVVGIQNGFMGKLGRVKNYIFKYNASSYARELLSGYSNQMDDEWRAFFEKLIKANNSTWSRLSLLADKQIKFNSFILRSTFVVKVLMKKL